MLMRATKKLPVLQKSCRKMAPISPRDRGHISPSICRDPLSRLYHRRKTLRNHFVIHSEPLPAHRGMWRHIAAQFVQHEGLRMVLNPLVEEVERTVHSAGLPHAIRLFGNLLSRQCHGIIHCFMGS